MAQHSCVMCRDFTRLDEFASNLDLNHIEEDAVTTFSEAKDALLPILAEIKAPEHVGNIRDLDSRLTDLQNSMIGMSNEKIAELQPTFNTYENDLNVLLQEDKRLADLFAVRLFQLAVSRQVLTDMNDHIGRARLFCVWLAGSVEYTLSTETISAYGKSQADHFRTRTTFCAGYATIFVNMFNAVTTQAHASAGTDAQFLAQYTSGLSKQISRKVELDENKGRNLSDGHAWAIFPSAVNAGGAASNWKLVDPCWIRGGDGPANVGPNAIASEWFYNSNETFARTHRSTLREDRLLSPRTVGETQAQFEAKDLAPFNQNHLAFQIEESSLFPQQYTQQPQQVHLFSFRRLCIGSRPLPTVFLVPVKDGEYSTGEAEPFARAGGGIEYTTSMNSAKLAQTFTGQKLELEVAVAYDRNNQPLTLGLTNLWGKRLGDVSWATIASYLVTK